jgi:hypothetical protein
MAKKQISNYKFFPGVVPPAFDQYPDAVALIDANKTYIVKEILAYLEQATSTPEYKLAASQSAPYAIALLTANKEFIKEEANAWTLNQISSALTPFVYNAAKCERDLEYILTGVAYDLSLGTNYNSVFLGKAESNSLDFTQDVLNVINVSRNSVKLLPAVAGSPAISAAVTTSYATIGSVALGGSTAISFTNPTGASVNQTAAKDKLISNKAFIQAEVNAWVALNFPAYDHDVAKCTRDIGYAIDAACYDILYGGNSASYDQAKFFFYAAASGAPGIAPVHKVQTISAYDRFKSIISDIITGSSITATTGGSLPNLLTQNISGASADIPTGTTVTNLIQITLDVINADTQAAANGALATYTKTYPSILWAAAGVQAATNAILTNTLSIANTTVSGSYNYSLEKQIKCKRDIGYLVDAFITDLTGGGNAETIRISRMFYLNGEAQLLNAVQEEAVHTFVKNLITNYVLTNTTYPTNQTPTIAAQVLLTSDSESYAITKLTALNNIVINIIRDGLTSLPAVTYNFNQQFAEYVYGATKCKRDIAYVLDAVAYDVALATNYNAVFIGRAESNSLDLSQKVIDTINASKALVLALPAVSVSGTAIARVNSDYTEILTIAEGGASSALTFTTPTGQTTSLVAVKDKLVANRAFIQAEINAWVGFTYPLHNHNIAKCSRDVGYAVDAFCYDMLYGGNSATYDNAKFFLYSGAVGITEEHKAQTVAAYGRLETIIGQIVQGQTVVKTTTGTTPNTLTQVTSGNNAILADAEAVQALAQVIADVVDVGLSALPATRDVPSVTWAALALQNAKTSIETNSVTIQNTVVPYSDYTYNAAKCERDSIYVIDSYLYDMTYGGNSLSYYVASRYQINGVLQVQTGEVEVITQTFARDMINDYILQNIYHPSYQYDVYQTVDLSLTSESGADERVTVLSDIIIDTIGTGISALPAPVAPNPKSGTLLFNAVTLLNANKRFIQEETIAFIQFGVDNNIAPYVFYTYNAEKCRRDISYILEGYISDLSFGGNRQTYFNASKYWENGVAQVDGDRQPEIYAHTFIRDLIENFIWTNTAFTPRQILASQVINNSIDVESFANTRIKELSNTVLDVIRDGVLLLPTKVSNLGYVKLAGFYKLKDLLLITNASRNIIMYNFADTNSGAEVTYSENFDSDVPGALYGFSQITTITFDVDTSDMMITDNIQIFVEGKEQAVRLNPIATDAMERMKVGIPQSMLDADFEYGLQPTKWQALSMMRNYPSIYEIPGSDIAVTNVVTDASAGTGGAGASSITVTTQNAHGLAIGDPITIKALANSISGFSRAEGSFLVSSVTPTTFVYFAKSKVGTTNGQVLASTYTQLRRGGFYTGSAIGSPSFTVFSAGSSGTITTSLTTASGRDTIGFTGSPPPVGSPLSGTGINTGTQVTAVTGSGGPVASTQLVSNAEIGATSIVVANTTGINPGLVFDRGDGFSAVVTDVVGNTVSLGSALTSAIIGTTENYNALAQDFTSGTGVGATVSIARSGSTYTTTVNGAGSGYVTNDIIVILGTRLGGTTSTNDATITITEASPVNSVLSFNSGTLIGGSGYSSGTAVATTGGTGTGLTVNVTQTGGVVTNIGINQSGSGYTVGDSIAVVQPLGAVLTYTQTNVGSGYGTANNLTTSTSGSGTGLIVNVVDNGLGAIASITVVSRGQGYAPSDSFTVISSGLRGAVLTTNNLSAGNGYSSASGVVVTGGAGSGATVNITANVIGGVTQVNNVISGSGYTGSIIGFSPSGGTGSGLIVDALFDGSNGIASVTISNGGSGYTPGNTFTITGGNNDASFQVQSVSLGSITGITLVNGGDSYVVGNTLSIPGGNGNATFGVASVTFYDGTFDISTVSTAASINVATVLPGGVIQSVTTTGTPITAPTRSFISAFTISEGTTAQIASGSTGITFAAIATIQVNFASAHGFIPGDTLTVAISSTGAGAQLAGGPFFVEQVPDANTIRYTARASGNIDNTLVGVIYGRPDSFFIHRPFDGGVQLGTASPSHGATAIRMSKKYIRYQSGKGVMYNTGALFAPSYDIRSMTATGTTVGSIITLVTDDTDHGCQIGGIISVSGVLTAGYNSTYTVVDVFNERQLSVIANQTLGSTNAVLGSPCQMSIRNWHGSTIRAGIFDDQNGMFWQYDGIRMAVVRRSSTFQLAGTIAIAANSNLVTGNNTRFTSQLAAGDRVVIRGMSHVVSQVTDDSTMFVTPDFRGVANVNEAKIVKTTDIQIPQSDWNLDTLNGAGPSGYLIDVTKMQMIGLQHTWYGAGFIDFMLRGPEGNYTFAHRFRNSNVNSEAYMRTGNQPVRYEVINEGARDKLVESMTAVQTTIPLENSYWFPNSGTVIIDSELIRFTGNINNTLTGCTRGTVLTQFTAGSQRSFSGSPATTHSVRSGVILVSNTITPNISHWGSAFMIDGQFDSDRGYIFNYAATAISASVEKNTAFLIRLAPSVSNAQVGDLGEKELLNRAQLLLNAISVTSDPVDSNDPFVGNTWSSGGTATSGQYYTRTTSAGVKNWYQATSTGTFSATPPEFASGTGASGTFGVNLTWAGVTPNNNGAIVVEGVLNPANYPTDPTKITWTGLAASAAGGQPSFAQIASGGSVTWSGNASTSTATVQGAFTTTLTAKSFNLATASLTATSFNQVQQNITARSFSSATSGTYTTALNNARSDFLVLQSDLSTLNASTTVTAGDVLTVLGNGTTLSNVVINNLAGDVSFNATANTLYVGQTVTITGTFSNTAFTLANVNITGTSGQFTCNFASQTMRVGMRITVSGTITGGSITGYTNPTTYLISATNGSTTFTLTTVGGATLTTTLGATTGSTFQVLPPSITGYFSGSVYRVAATNGTTTATLTTTGGAAIVTSGGLPTGLTYTVASFINSTTINSVTQNFITLNSVPYARIVMNSVPQLTSATSATDGQFNVIVRITSSLTATYNSAISNARTDFLIPNAQAGTVALADVLSTATFITGGQSISTITPSFGTISGITYARIVMTGAGTATSVAGAGNNVTVTSTSSATNTYNRALTTTRSDFLITDAQFAGSGIQLSDTLSAATFITGGQTISSITQTYVNIGGTNYTRIVMSGVANASSPANSANDVTVTVTAAGTAANYTAKNFVFFTSASWIASGATVSTKVAASVTLFPAGTSVAATSTRTFGAVTVFRVTFTQTASGTFNASDAITFQFGANFALPGEQVFSFIANPGNTEVLPLEELKELTATALGGRGTFPNGPDVLAINVYKVAGSAIPTNIILRWGEAQA